MSNFPEALVERVARAIEPLAWDDGVFAEPGGAGQRWAQNSAREKATAAISASGLAEAIEALEWATPLASRALDDTRIERIRCGHSDIRGTDANGTAIVGLWQKEIDERDQARAVLANLKASK